MRNSIWILGAVLLSACGPAGVLSGKVTVEGADDLAVGVAVIAYGPQSAATVTSAGGAFSISNLPDGVYVVRATLRGADVEEVSASTTITQGKSSPEPVLAFRASKARVTGRVVMADGSGAQELTVTATGPETRGTRTAADGSYTFDGLKTGAYVVSVEGPDTLEGRVAVGVNASGGSPAVPDLRLTPVGRIAGTVLYGTAGAAGVPVIVTGTNVSTVTDAMGHYSLNNVPTGMQALQARVGSAPFFRTATAMVDVVRGANADVALTLTDDAPRTGTVTGVVTFHGPRNPRDITVSAPGTNVTATPQVNGAYSLALPVGVWNVVANAPQHPTLTLGRVTVTEGQAQSLPGAEVSWYRPVWRSTPFITPPATVASGVNDNNPWSLVTFNDATSRLALINSTTYDFRILASGSTSQHRISKAGKYAGWVADQTVFVYEIGTANLQTFSTLNPPALQQSIFRIEFSSDETALFIQRNPVPVGAVANLTRIKFATPSNPEVFPPGGANSTGIYLSSVDRWFVRDSSNAIRLVTPSIDVASVFTQVSSFSATPTAWALTNCVLNCELWVLSPTSITTALRDNSINPTGLSNFTALLMDNRGDYPCFSTGTAAFCVKSSDAMHIPLAAIPNNFRLNEAGDRVVWTFTSGMNQVVREEVMPPTSTANLGSNVVGWNVGWISPTRAIAYEASGSPRAMHLIKAGVATVDNDVGGQSVILRPPMVVFPQSSTSQWRAYLGDGAIRSLPVATNIPVAVGSSAISVRPLGTGPTAVTRYGSVSFDTASSFIVDETPGAAMVRPISAGYSAGTANRSGAIEWFDINRPGGARAKYVYNTNVLLEDQEQSVLPASAIGAPGVQSFLGYGDDQRTIYVGSFLP